MKALALALVASLFSAPAIPQSRPPSLIDSGWPPERYMGEAVAITAYVNDPQEICGRDPSGKYRTLACASREKRIMVLPNPCAAEFREEMFARIACHEKGHINGWPGTHGA